MWWEQLERARLGASGAAGDGLGELCVLRRDKMLRSGDAVRHTYTEDGDDGMGLDVAMGMGDSDAVSDDGVSGDELEDVPFYYDQIAKKASASSSGAASAFAAAPPTPRQDGLDEDDFLNDLDDMATPMVEPTMDPMPGQSLDLSPGKDGNKEKVVHRILETFTLRRVNRKREREKIF